MGDFSCLLFQQGKQKRNNRKGKEKGREERPDIAVQDKHQGNPSDEGKDSPRMATQTVHEKPDMLEDVSDVSDSMDGIAHAQPDSEDRDASTVNWDTDTSEVQPTVEASSNGQSSIQNGLSDKKSQSLMDDSSSTCSTDSVPSVVTNGPYKGNNFPNTKIQKSPSRFNFTECFSFRLMKKRKKRKKECMALICSPNLQGKESREGNVWWDQLGK